MGALIGILGLLLCAVGRRGQTRHARAAGGQQSRLAICAAQVSSAARRCVATGAVPLGEQRVWHGRLRPRGCA
eukprot:2996180-Prymnesium_polylepis.1